MKHSRLLAECRDLVRCVAPELRDWPLYLLDSRQLPDDYPQRDCLGWARPPYFESPAIREAIGIDYEGLGPVIALDFEAIELAAEPGWFERCVLTTTIHEAAHLLPLPPTPIVDIPENNPVIREWEIERAKLEVSASRENEKHDLDGHGFDFRRRAVHLWSRAAIGGYEIPIGGLFGYAHWHLSDATDWLPWLLPEALAMKDRTFAAVAAEEVPDGLSELWKNDQKRIKVFLSKERERKATKCQS